MGTKMFLWLGCTTLGNYRQGSQVCCSHEQVDFSEWRWSRLSWQENSICHRLLLVWLGLWICDMLYLSTLCKELLMVLSHMYIDRNHCQNGICVHQGKSCFLFIIGPVCIGKISTLIWIILYEKIFLWSVRFWSLTQSCDVGKATNTSFDKWRKWDTGWDWHSVTELYRAETVAWILHSVSSLVLCSRKLTGFLWRTYMDFWGRNRSLRTSKDLGYLE